MPVAQPTLERICRRAAKEAQPLKIAFEEHLSALTPKVVDAFSRLAIDGARHALADSANPLQKPLPLFDALGVAALNSAAGPAALPHPVEAETG